MDVMLNYKTKKCMYLHHDICRFFHSNSDSRRFHIDMNTHTMNYWNILYLPGIMPESQRFSYCQNLFEYNYHVGNYKTKECPYLAIVGVCQQGDHCYYIHPKDNLEELIKFRASISPPPTFIGASSDLLDNHSFLHSSDKRIPKHIAVLPNDEEAYIQG